MRDRMNENVLQFVRRCYAEEEPAVEREVALWFSIPLETAQRHLAALAGEGWIDYRPDTAEPIRPVPLATQHGRRRVAGAMQVTFSAHQPVLSQGGEAAGVTPDG